MNSNIHIESWVVLKPVHWNTQPHLKCGLIHTSNTLHKAFAGTDSLVADTSFMLTFLSVNKCIPGLYLGMWKGWKLCNCTELQHKRAENQQHWEQRPQEGQATCCFCDKTIYQQSVIFILSKVDTQKSHIINFGE